ncbi:glutathione synthetase, chloroplastic-like isoform X1 [Mangifera indica]|uniref:glutathione synthetase, chloroplastic-like isoform X1 n=1 Tax=Mangifera indica TaxID=29780 RepID=UPI001CFB7CAF|nr:glutathione synthetase, chloroplastic-like isoform X1 [Mangifera indica]XP_044500722.1 glutathione synthetase, chloroplastic-like isoform X1 [Mangifera indica]XP_044500723.1 glutathione synthetase, chloroplastic-like isoform X1 [Mangifera indica]XP_044500724.1 glutathione synthetase, chloroplastic-like isoform X1 [Mangifera indica]
MMLLFGALFMALLLETKTCRSLLIHYGEHLGLDSKKIPDKSSVSQFAEAMVKAWTEYNNSRAVVMVVFQSEDCKLYDQHWLCSVLKEKYNITTIQKTLAEIDVQGKLLPDGTLLVSGQPVSLVYFRAGYAPADYPSESEWRARLRMEQSSAIKCPCISII